jgi:phosphopantetheinyl transferase (holo-ACP synthase)
VFLEGDENQRLELELQISRCHISFSHEKDYTIATAVV